MHTFFLYTWSWGSKVAVEKSVSVLKNKQTHTCPWNMADWESNPGKPGLQGSWASLFHAAAPCSQLSNFLSDTELRNHTDQAPISVVLRISPSFYLSQHSCKIRSFPISNRGLLWQSGGWVAVEQLCNLKWPILAMSKFGVVCLGRSAPVPFLRINPIRALWF